MVRLVAGAAQMIGQRRVRVGEEFECELGFAMDLISCGLASVAPPRQEPDKEPEPELELPALLKKRGPDKKPRKKRTYNRRDMEAE